MWQHATRSVDPLHDPIPPAVTPRSPAILAPTAPAPTAPALAAPAPAFSPKPPPPPALPPPRPTRRLDPNRPVDLDRRSWLKLRRGLYPIDARLDLHGLTQDQAHGRLAAFLVTAHARGQRCVLVITGRGLRHGGTLRSATPRWLDEGRLRGLVLSYAEARLTHGGEGALYVLLRRG